MPSFLLYLKMEAESRSRNMAVLLFYDWDDGQTWKDQFYLLFRLSLGTEDGSNMFLRNLYVYLHVHTASHPKRTSVDIFAAVRASDFIYTRRLTILMRLPSELLKFKLKPWMLTSDSALQMAWKGEERTIKDFDYEIWRKSVHLFLR
jgi:hypothetical protein